MLLLIQLVKRRISATKLLKIPLDETVSEHHRQKIVIKVIIVLIIECWQTKNFWFEIGQRI